MKKYLVLALSAAAALAVPGAANAQAYQSINQRQDNQFRRIEQGVRTGALTRPEARRLRAEFRDLTVLERRYRNSNGLSRTERGDLNRRFDALSRRVRMEKNDRQDRRR
ncbi:hypothetical protein [uncultured Sphingomonas sp.]|uniref:hypothetical protein n=1 Tax=uncultured Sphingomonas sp. TaxID=158754 RepID=UPI0035CC5A04